MNNTPTFVKLKPNEVAVPEWTQYVAQDEHGEWYAYEGMPECETSKIQWTYNFGKFRLIHTSEPNPNWKSTLIKI